LKELPDLYQSSSPWVFLCAAALVEYLAKLVEGKDKGAQGYKDFVRNWLAQVHPAYASFKYLCGESDLPEQMYHVLRCGIVHSLSFIPDTVARKKGGRDRSIVLCHRPESLDRSMPHLANYSTSQIPDAAVFVAEDFVDDIAQVVERVFAKATPGSTLEANMMTWLSSYPLLSGGY
jgi:hypothetical protein